MSVLLTSSSSTFVMGFLVLGFCSSGKWLVGSTKERGSWIGPAGDLGRGVAFFWAEEKGMKGGGGVWASMYFV